MHVDRAKAMLNDGLRPVNIEDGENRRGHDGIPFEVKCAVPNAETKVALAEYEAMRNHPENYKRYDSFSELLDEALDNA